MLEGTAGEKARKLLDRLYDFRSSEAKKLEDNPELTIGDTTIVNLTMMEVSYAWCELNKHTKP